MARRYEVQSEIARGGMGVVYRAVDRSSGEAVVLKRMLGTDEPSQRALFEREYQTLVRLRHPSIIEVFDYGVDDEGPYYTMELLEGKDIRHLSPLPPKEACRHLRTIASSLALLHSRGWVHRDVSPNNVRVTVEGHCKLLDFGAVAAFGPCPDVIGSPPLVAPELFHGLPVDQRVDIYALGGLAYWMLTGRHAYPARRLTDLTEVWKSDPKPPSAHAPEVSAELDRLVIEMLSRDPDVRPRHAAEVIDRLNAIAELEPAEDLPDVAQSYFVGTAIVGRRREIAKIQGCVDRLRKGSGALLWIDGERGTGRSRMLTELGRSSQLGGAIVAQISAAAHPERFGSARAIAEQLLSVLAGDAIEAAAPYAQELARLSPRIAEMLAVDPPEEGSTQLPGEERARILAALRGWVLDLSDRWPVAIALDDAEAADSASLGLMLSLGMGVQSHRVLVAIAWRNTVPVPESASWLRARGTTITLRPLAADDVHKLVSGLLGDTAACRMLSQWLYRHFGGNLLYTFDVLRDLASREVIRYVDGSWTVPQDLPAPDEATMRRVGASRVEGLTAAARELATKLSLQAGVLPSAAWITIAGGDRRLAADALEELVLAGLVRRTEQGVVLVQPTVREYLTLELDADERRHWHRELAESLLSCALDAGENAQTLLLDAGRHLMEAGEESRGATVIARTDVRGLLRRGGGGLEASVSAIESALKVYVRERRSVYDVVPLLSFLAHAGYWVHWRYAVDYAEQALSSMAEVTGLSLARRLQRFLGGRLGLVCALFVAHTKFAFSRRKPPGSRFGSFLEDLFSAALAIHAVSGITANQRLLDAVVSVLEPFAALSDRTTPAGIYAYCDTMKRMWTVDAPDARDTAARLLQRFEDATYFRHLPDDGRAAHRGGLLYVLGIYAVWRCSDEALELADRLDGVGMRLYAMFANVLRVLHHTSRCQLAEAREAQERLALQTTEYGSAWQIEMTLASSLGSMLVDHGHLLALRRNAERLELLASEAPSLAHYGIIPRSAHRILTGRADRAEAALARFVEDGSAKLGVENVAACYCDCLLELDRPQEALGVADRLLSTRSPAALAEYPGLYAQLRRRRARALACLGRYRDAREAIDRIERDYEGCGEFLGGLHALLRAEVEHEAGDRDALRANVQTARSILQHFEAPGPLRRCMELGAALARTSWIPAPIGDKGGLTPTQMTLVQDFLALLRQQTNAHSVSVVFLSHEDIETLASAGRPAERARLESVRTWLSCEPTHSTFLTRDSIDARATQAEDQTISVFANRPRFDDTDRMLSASGLRAIALPPLLALGVEKSAVLMLGDALEPPSESLVASLVDSIICSPRRVVARGSDLPVRTDARTETANR